MTPELSQAPSSAVPSTHPLPDLTGAASSVPQAAPIYYVVDARTVNLNNTALLKVVTGGVLTKNKALQLSKRKNDPLPVHRLPGLTGVYYINVAEWDVWSKRQEFLV